MPGIIFKYTWNRAVYKKISLFSPPRWKQFLRMYRPRFRSRLQIFVMSKRIPMENYVATSFERFANRLPRGATNLWLLFRNYTSAAKDRCAIRYETLRSRIFRERWSSFCLPAKLASFSDECHEILKFCNRELILDCGTYRSTCALLHVRNSIGPLVTIGARVTLLEWN